MSPEALQSHSLPSSVSDALEAMVGGGLDDLTLEDIDPSSLAEEQQQQAEVLYIVTLPNMEMSVNNLRYIIILLYIMLHIVVICLLYL